MCACVCVCMHACMRACVFVVRMRVCIKAQERDVSMPTPVPVQTYAPSQFLNTVMKDGRTNPPLGLPPPRPGL